MADTNQQGNQQNSSNKPAGLSWSQPPKPSTSPLLGSSASKVAPASAQSAAAKSGTLKQAEAVTSRGRLVSIFLAGAAVGALFVWGYYTFDANDTVVREETETTNVPVPAAPEPPGVSNASGQTGSASGVTSSASGTGGIVLPNPQPAGLKVDITSAPVAVPTWVVVYEVINGQRGNALGAGYFTPATGARSINLLRATEPGKVYWVGKRVDNGDKDFTSADQPVLNAAGQPLYVEFRAI